eukprot:Em0006g905a
MERMIKTLKAVKDTFVSKDKGAQPLRMLLIGETGSGKTSFLNLMCNANVVHKLGFETGVETFRAFNDLSVENAEERQMESKTSGANQYEVRFDEVGLTIGIIDTPGFGDTRGLTEDKKNTKKIVDTVKEAQYIHCICLVINARQSRMSSNLKYVLSEVSGVLPKATLNNLVVVLTNAKDESDASFDVRELTTFLGKEIPVGNVFYIDNPYCKWEKLRQKSGTTEISKQLAKKLQRDFSDASDALASMFELVQGFEEVHTDSFMKLYILKEAVERNTLAYSTACDNAKSKKDAIDKKMNDLQEMKKSNEDKWQRQEFKATYTFETWVQVPTSNHNTLCGFNGCRSNCHVSCGLPKTLDKSNLLSCCCMNGNTCRVCGHPYDAHSHLELLHEKKTETKIVEDVNAKNTLQADKKSIDDHISALDSEAARVKKETQDEMAFLSANLLTKLHEFEELSSASSYMKCVENQLCVIEQKIESVQDDDDRSIMSDLRTTQAKLKMVIDLVKTAKKLPWSDSAPIEVKSKWAREYLHVEASATGENIERAYKAMALSKHPDKGGSEEEFKLLQQAYQILCKR